MVVFSSYARGLTSGHHHCSGHRPMVVLTGCLCCFDDRGGIDPEMPVEIGYCSGLAEMFDAEAGQRMTVNRTEPAERGWMTVGDGDRMGMVG